MFHHVKLVHACLITYRLGGSYIHYNAILPVGM